MFDQAQLSIEVLVVFSRSRNGNASHRMMTTRWGARGRAYLGKPIDIRGRGPLLMEVVYWTCGKADVYIWLETGAGRLPGAETDLVKGTIFGT